MTSEGHTSSHESCAVWNLVKCHEGPTPDGCASDKYDNSKRDKLGNADKASTYAEASNVKWSNSCVFCA